MVIVVVQDNGVPLASNQVQYSLLYREPETNGVADAVREAGATLIAYSPLNQGLLTGTSLLYCLVYRKVYMIRGADALCQVGTTSSHTAR